MAINNYGHILFPDDFLNIYMAAGEVISHEYFPKELEYIDIDAAMFLLNLISSSCMVDLKSVAINVGNENRSEPIQVKVDSIKGQPFLYAVRNISRQTGANYYIEKNGKKLIFDFSDSVQPPEG